MKKYSMMLLVALLMLLLLLGCASDAQDGGVPDDSIVEQEEVTSTHPPEEEKVEPIVSIFTEEDIASAEAFGKAHIEAWKAEDWCISLELLESKYSPELTEFYATNYIGQHPDWTREYMAENFIVVTIKYECKLDHNLIFYPDGKCYIDLFVTRANADAPWESWDSTGIHEMT